MLNSTSLKVLIILQDSLVGQNSWEHEYGNILKLAEGS